MKKARLCEYYRTRQDGFEKTRERIRVREAKKLIKKLHRLAKKSPSPIIYFFVNEQGIPTCEFGTASFRTYFRPESDAEDLQFVEELLNKEGYFISSFTKPIAFTYTY